MRDFTGFTHNDYKEFFKVKTKPSIDYRTIASRFLPVLRKQVSAREIEKLIFTHRELGTTKFRAFLALEAGLKRNPQGFWGMEKYKSITLYSPQGLALEEYAY